MTEISFADQQAALRARDVITRMVQREITLANPRPRFATVTEITPSNYRCRVEFQPGTDSAVARFGSIQPTHVGQKVRVSGPPDDLWVIDVIGGGTLSGEPSDNIDTPTGFSLFGVGPGFVADWNGLTYVDRYELQVADDVGFTVGVASFVTQATQFTVQGLIVGETYYARVRGLSGGSSLGPWSGTLSIVVDGYPTAGASDGIPPASSPIPVCQPGLGQITVEWTLVPNNDLITYEIHADLESGFTPAPATLLGETTANFWAIRRLPDDSALPYTVPTFVRLVAKDVDGSAPAGPQGFASPDSLTSDDFGAVENLSISDGITPATSPASFNVTAGIGYLFLTWTGVANGDQVTYEIHMSTSPGFTPTANTFTIETQGTFAFLRKLPPGFGGGPIDYETTYWIKLWAKDRDGYAPTSSPAQSGTTIKTGSSDIENGAVGTVQLADAAIVTAKIAEAAIGEANIQSAAITTAKIANGAITNAKIGNAVVENANIANLAVGTAKIANGAITDAKIGSLNADKIIVGTLSGITITGNTITGNTISGSTIIGGSVTGAVVRSAASGARIEIDGQTDAGYVRYFSGNAAEQASGYTFGGYGVDPYGRTSGFITTSAPQMHGASESQTRLELWHVVANGARIAKINGTLEVEGLAAGGTSPLLFKTSGMNPGLLRGIIAGTYTQFNYSNYADVSFKLQEDGNMVLWQSGVAVWAAGTSISDARVKNNVRAANLDDTMMAFRSVPIVNFEFNPAGHPLLPTGVRLGVLAQDMEAVFPRAVMDIEGSKLLDQSAMVGLLMAVARNLDDRVTALETRR